MDTPKQVEAIIEAAKEGPVIQRPGDPAHFRCVGIINKKCGRGSWYIFGYVDELINPNDHDIVVYTYYTEYKRFGTSSLSFLLSMGDQIRSCRPSDIPLLLDAGCKLLEGE